MVLKRYSTPEMLSIWSIEGRWSRMWEVEKAVAWAQGTLGIIPKESAEEINRVEFEPEYVERINELEKVTNHDVVAFVFTMEEVVGAEHGRWIHFGLTSSDVLDTAFAMQIKESFSLLLPELEKLIATFYSKAVKFRDVLGIGRTHGVHAEPMPFGFKFLRYASHLLDVLDILRKAQELSAHAKIAGAVGTYSTVSPEVERLALEKLGLVPEPVATQIVPRFRYAYVLNSLALLMAVYEDFSTEIRHLHRTEVAEAFEPFSRGQAGSSAMPHKKNPITFERICGLSRLIRAYALTSYENIPLWHERDISHSSVERISFPESFNLVHYATRLLQKMIPNITVSEDSLKANLNRSQGRYFSSLLLLELIKLGLTRQEAYRLVQRIAGIHGSFNYRDFKEATFKILEDEGFEPALIESISEKVFDESIFLRSSEGVFRRFQEKALERIPGFFSLLEGMDP